MRCEEHTYQCCLAVLPAAVKESELVALGPAPKSSPASVDASSLWSLTVYWGRGGVLACVLTDGSEFVVGTGITHSALPPTS